MTCEREEELARQILALARRRIAQANPLLLQPIHTLTDAVRPEEGPLSTDGRHLFFCPWQVVEDFRQDREKVARQLIHVTLHCLLGHLERRQESRCPQLFDLAADAKVYLLAESLLGNKSLYPRLALPADALPEASVMPLQRLTELWGKDRQRLKAAVRHSQKLREDDHSQWPVVVPLLGPGEGPQDGQEDLSQLWQQQAETLLEQIQGSSPQRGRAEGLLVQELNPGRVERSCRSLLQELLCPREQALEDPDTLDLQLYCRGLELYGDIPLVEPSELSEPPAPREVVIALDTSGSCGGKICQQFVSQTAALLQDLTEGLTRFHILLLQCDSRIQQELLLETPEQVEELCRSFQAKGFGGTDFRPVFRRVEQLREEGTLSKLRGLIYFSDAWGAFPEEAPDYPVLFFLPPEERDPVPPEFPDWAQHYRLSPDMTHVQLEKENA